MYRPLELVVAVVVSWILTVVFFVPTLYLHSKLASEQKVRLCKAAALLNVEEILWQWNIEFTQKLIYLKDGGQQSMRDEVWAVLQSRASPSYQNKE